jgi:hypothetical protein
LLVARVLVASRQHGGARASAVPGAAEAALGGTERFARRVHEASLAPDLHAELAPLLAVLQTITEQIDECDKSLGAMAQQHAPTRLLTTMPCVAAVTAATFACVIDDPKRFRSGHHVSAYLGLVPREYSSGETRRLGGITKAGNARVRSLLVQAALRIRRCKPASMQDLVDWSESSFRQEGGCLCSPEAWAMTRTLPTCPPAAAPAPSPHFASWSGDLDRSWEPVSAHLRPVRAWPMIAAPVFDFMRRAALIKADRRLSGPRREDDRN